MITQSTLYGFFYLDSAHYIVIFISGPHFLKRLMIYDKYVQAPPLV